MQDHQHIRLNLSKWDKPQQGVSVPVPHPCCWTDPHQQWRLLQLFPGTCLSLLLSEQAKSCLLSDSFYLISALLSSVFTRQKCSPMESKRSDLTSGLSLHILRITMLPSGKMGSLCTARQMWPLIETLCCRKLLKARPDQEPTTCDHLAGTVLHNACVFFRLPNWTPLAK